MLIHKDIDLVNFLLRLYPPSFDIYIHIDKKSSIEKKDVITLSNIVWIGKEMNIEWASYEMIEIELRLLKEAYMHDYDYYHLVSGQCLCLRTHQEIDEIIFKNGRKSFVEKRFEVTDGKLYDKFMLGSQWWSLNKKTVHWIFSHWNKVQELDREYTKSIRVKDEMIFQTLLYNNVSEMLVNNNLRYIKFFASVHPQMVGIDKYDMLMDGGYVFTRKVDFENSKELIDKVAQRLLTKNRMNRLLYSGT